MAPKIDPDDFEYNDGLGDLLREKERLRFSWAKTAGVLVVLFLVVMTGVWLTFKIGDSFITKSPSPSVSTPKEKEKLSDIEINNAKNIKELEIAEEKMTPQNNGSKAVYAPLETESKVKVVTKPTPKPLNKEKMDNVPKFKVIAGTYTTYDNAKSYASQIQKKKVDSFIWRKRDGGKTFYVVQCGAFVKQKQAQLHVETLNKKGVSAYVLASN